jgi:hypothetical protein
MSRILWASLLPGSGRRAALALGSSLLVGVAVIAALGKRRLSWGLGLLDGALNRGFFEGTAASFPHAYALWPLLVTRRLKTP